MAKRVLLVGALLALSGCGDPNTMSAQANREARRPIILLVDTHGCKWRLDVDSSSIPNIHPQIKQDGIPDCPPAPVPPPPAPVAKVNS